MLVGPSVAFVTVTVPVATAGLKFTESVGRNVTCSGWVPTGKTVPTGGEKTFRPGTTWKELPTTAQAPDEPTWLLVRGEP